VDFGHAVFFGLGAYGTGVLMVKLGVPFPIAVLGGAVVAAIFAFLIGSATLRLKGPYFSIAMLGTFVAMREIVRIIKPITGGGSGLTLPPYLNRPLFYYVTLIGMAIVVLLIWLMRRTQFGASLIAIREDEVGAEMRGINTTRHKITIFCLACFSTGIVGGLWAYQNTFIDPDIVFFESRTIELVMMTILGGLGTVAGPVVGATVLYWLRDIIWANFLDYHLIVQGIMLILIVLFVPEGIMGIIGDPDSTSLGRLWKKHFGQGEETEQPTTTTEVQS
ncbi:MAG: branched-chain amino acid ABC transporter permease, partial [Anaerolineae bacterium]|nr:branched-chain amino acid ABC transporter permease [Anaerolineae bacterium]